jgi:large subunit ribosomal protein L17
VSSLIRHKSITTTKVKAKEASRLAERLVAIAKEKSVNNQRKAYRILQDRDLVLVLFNEIAPLFKERNGGYTRVIMTSNRRGDNSQMAILEFVERPKPEPATKKEKKKKTTQPEQPLKVEEKDEVSKKKEGPKEEPKKVIETQRVAEPPQEPKKPRAPRPGFFKRFFGRKQDR